MPIQSPPAPTSRPNKVPIETPPTQPVWPQPARVLAVLRLLFFLSFTGEFSPASAVFCLSSCPSLAQLVCRFTSRACPASLRPACCQTVVSAICLPVSICRPPFLLTYTQHLSLIHTLSCPLPPIYLPLLSQSPQSLSSLPSVELLTNSLS